MILAKAISTEPSQNVAVAINYQIDEIIFFAKAEQIADFGESSEKFLRDFCGVKDVKFYEISGRNLGEILINLDEILAKFDEICFDISGGDKELIIAFGIIANARNLGVIDYDITQNSLQNLTQNFALKSEKKIIRLKDFIPLMGGGINYKMQKENKAFLSDENYKIDIEKIWQISQKHFGIYNTFSNVLKNLTKNADKMVKIEISHIENLLKNNANLSFEKFREILCDLSNFGLINELKFDKICEFAFKNENIKNILKEAGAVLELHAFYALEMGFDECRVGIHIDWDGDEKNKVFNEIDILGIRDARLSFISCKNGEINQMPLYELDAVARKIGGKYAQKILVLTHDLSLAHLERAKELGIKIYNIRKQKWR